MPTVYRVGTSGFSYPHWRGTFYPKGVPQARWLEHYAQQFSTVELNSSFYRLPQEETFQGWRNRVPEGFLFAVKASRTITHLRRLRDVAQPLENFISRVRTLQQRLGPLLYQLPPSMARDEELLDSFLSLLPSDLHHVVEFRNQSWYEKSVLELLGRHNVALCIHDMARRQSPVAATANFAYFRFHGPSGRYAGSYSDQQLQEWAQRIVQLGPGFKVVYIYFNNDVGGHAVANARTISQLLRFSTIH